MTTDPRGGETSSDTSGRILNQGRRLVREGTIRRVIIKRGDETIAHIPVIAVVVVAVVAPWLVAVGVLIALLNHCTIAVQRANEETEPGTTAHTSSELGGEGP